MNSLESYIEQNGMDPAEVMNALQTMAPLGTCSDNAVTPADVGTAGAAVFWVHTHRELFTRISRNRK
jgi:hypothetical protein